MSNLRSIAIEIDLHDIDPFAAKQLGQAMKSREGRIFLQRAKF